MRVELPTLKSRNDDIPWLMELFLEQFKGGDRCHIRGFSALAQDVALEHDWPGNVRELRNRVERAVALANGEWIMPADMFPELAQPHAADQAVFATLSEARDSAERRQIERVLRLTGGQIIETAKLLGVSRTTLWDKMRRLGLSGETV